MKKKLKVLVLFDGTSPTTVDQDFTKELKTKDWKTEADVMAALGALGHTAEHLAIYDDVDLVRGVCVATTFCLSAKAFSRASRSAARCASCSFSCA